MLGQFYDPSQLTCYHSSVFLSSLDGVFRSVFQEVFRVSQGMDEHSESNSLP